MFYDKMPLSQENVYKIKSAEEKKVRKQIYLIKFFLIINGNVSITKIGFLSFKRCKKFFIHYLELVIMDHGGDDHEDDIDLSIVINRCLRDPYSPTRLSTESYFSV